jgi:riboflavin-specific deaminase-like protein
MAQHDAMASFRHFKPHAAGRPFIVAQLGQSLDGRIATITGDSRYIGSEPSLRHLHAIRAHVDAVVVGIGTVLADDPQLNVRLCAGENPARVVIDAKGRLPPFAKCLNGTDGARRIVLRGEGAAGEPLPAGVEIVHLRIDAAGHFDLAQLPAAFAALGFGKVLVEGGARIISSAIDCGIIDRLHLMVSPVLIGSGQSGVELEPVRFLRDARRPVTEVTLLGGGEVLFDCDLSCR